MQLDQQILSDITVHMKYAKWIEEEQRRETWNEIVDRNKQMHLDKFKGNDEVISHINWAYKFVYDKKILPSMRSSQFAGRPIEINNSRIFNCAFCPINSYEVFSEIMFLLLGGTGVGYSVQNHDVEKLPEITRPTKERRYLIGDSIEGWSDAIKMLMKSYFGITKSKPRFDFRDIREKGAKLITSGGKAPGPEPLKNCLHQIELILDRKHNGEQLTALECHDIVCHIADAVLAGGIRRAALISLFDIDDEEMLTCKFGNWWERNPQRGRANNSAVVIRHKIKKDKFLSLWEKVKESGSGEPGFFLSQEKTWGCNPCAEISLRPYQFCNLVDINVSNIEGEDDYLERIEAATIIATLQASYTDFHYLRDIWKQTTEKEALIGVGQTGIASNKVTPEMLERGAEFVKVVNETIADKIGINKAARTTTVKPAGTTSLVLGCSSGIHAWHNDYYIRRIRIGKNEDIYPYLKETLPELIEDEFFKPNEQAVLSIPQKAPAEATTRHETAISLLERVKGYQDNWIKPGHRRGDNTNNVSATISIKPDEWKEVGEWLWKNRDSYTGLSFLPYDNGTYKQAPFEDISESTYYRLRKNLEQIDLTKVKEYEDRTDLKGEVACGGGACEVV